MEYLAKKFHSVYRESEIRAQRKYSLFSGAFSIDEPALAVNIMHASSYF